MSDAHCPECGHYCADAIGQPCVSCFWRLKNERRDRAMGEAAAKAAKEEAMKINLKRDIQASLDKIEALKAENARLRGQRDELAAQIDAMPDWSGTEEVISEREMFRRQRNEALREVRDLREKVRGLEHDLSHAEDVAEGLKGDVRQAEEAYDKLRARYRQLEERLAESREDADSANAALAYTRGGFESDAIEAWKAHVAKLGAKIAELEASAGGVYATASDLTEENEELRSEVRRLTEVSLGLAAIVVGKG